MKKYIRNKNLIYNFILILSALLLILFISRGNFVYGSHVDFLKQHVTFPEYFRNLFYNSHKLFPEFSFNLAGGQNIFYFAYYGLMSPIILFSYLLPFISMEKYIIISSIIIVIISIIMFYYLLIKNKYTKETALFVSLLFLMCNGFLFHSHRHIMFMNYMPFLLLGLFGVNQYIYNKKSILLIISITLMIITSYYFSVLGLVTIFLYYLFKADKIDFKHTLSFISRIFWGILISSFFLLPVIYSIHNGRNNENINILFNYFIPQISSKFLLYDAYGIGCVSILWVSLIYSIIFEKKNIRIVSILLFSFIIFPIINLLFNGGLYLNGKILIPLTPLFLILIANMIDYTKINKTSVIWLNLSVILSLLFIEYKSLTIYMLLDLFITLILLNIYNIKRKKYILFPIIIIAIISSLIINVNDDLLSVQDIKERNDIINIKANEYFQDSKYMYRYQENFSNPNLINYSYGLDDYRTTIYSSTSNLRYINNFNTSFNNNDQYRNFLMVNQTNNLFFERFMGIRYLLKKNNVPYGYKEIKKFNNLSLYENNNVYPVGFSKTNLLNVNDYNKLDFNQKLEAFNNNIITSKKTSNPNLNFISKKINLKYKIIKQSNLSISRDNDNYIITSLNNNGKLVLGLDEAILDKSLIIRFKMNKSSSCPTDLKISINGVKNILTCKDWKYFNKNHIFDYVISSNDIIDKLNIKFGAGEYDISDILVYEIDNNFFNTNDIIPLKISNKVYKDNMIKGTINQLEDGYFIFTIPYDEGFNIYLDNKKIDYEDVNNGFIGFPISKGKHEIKLTFNAPYFKEGKIISICAFICLIPLTFYERKRNKVK